MNGCFSAGLFFLGFALLFVHPIIGICCILIASGVACESGGEETTTFVFQKWKRTINFGPTGPPWANDEIPLQIEGQAVFASSIARIHEEGPKPPDLKTRNGVTLPDAGTERPATIWVTLHSGENFKLTGMAANRIREWFDRVGVQKEAF